jgi:phosphoribosylanthranilate isomerase
LSRVRIKICGITRLDDALLAARLGADALGFNFWPGSKRYIDPDAAREIVDRLPPFVAPVGVFVNQPPTEVLFTAARAGIGTVQLHGDEGWDDVNGFAIPAVKALRVSGPESLADMHRYRVRAFLLDAPSKGFGGSGATFDWTVACEAAQRATVILAGGLTPENVREAIRAVRPFGVDVASGVERAPGVKDEEKLRRFIEAASEEDLP